MNDLSVLIVDDERVCRTTSRQKIENLGYDAHAAENGYEALELMTEKPFDVAIVDLRMPGMDGIELLKTIKNKSPRTDVIVMTAFGAVEDAVTAMRLGASDFLNKPFSFEILGVRLAKLAEQRLLRDELERAKRASLEPGDSRGIIGASEKMSRVREQVELFAHSELSVLIIGETGTGKEVVARAIASSGQRSVRPFVAVGCGAIPRDIAESELFGHERGSFTGAISQHRGVFERAHGGTLLIDDIDDLPLDLQSKLLRVIEEKKAARVGGSADIALDARVIATTKVDLHEASSRGRFRRDLYFRLKTLEIELPRLRDREGDVLLLATHFLSRIARATEAATPAISEEAVVALRRHAWPGNVRELKGAMESAFVLSRGESIELRHLPASLRDLAGNNIFQIHFEGLSEIDLHKELAAFERELIDWAMKKAGGRQIKAAELLGVPRTTFQSRFQHYHSVDEVSSSDDEVSSSDDEVSSDE
ncbi:MAG: sigma-54 dependent transcriptional regulator [Planctomycetes bacterium]|nr:sigma-54 dependent transcriptional regulator [Planctomycetota bacterium]